MPTLRDQLLPLISQVRQIPADLGFRPYTVTLRVRTWAGGRVGLPVGSTPDITDTVITPPPKVRQLSQREVDASGGRYQMGDFVVSGIVPSFTDGDAYGGFTPAQLQPTPTAAQDVVYLLTGPEGTVECTQVGSDFSRPTRYSLVLRMTAPPPRS